MCNENCRMAKNMTQCNTTQNDKYSRIRRYSNQRVRMDIKKQIANQFWPKKASWLVCSLWNLGQLPPAPVWSLLHYNATVTEYYKQGGLYSPKLMNFQRNSWQPLHHPSHPLTPFWGKYIAIFSRPPLSEYYNTMQTNILRTMVGTKFFAGASHH